MRAIKLYWWRNRDGSVNFGDDISATIVQRVSGRAVDWASLERCELIATGSLLDRVALRYWKRLARLNFRPLYVWGSGSLAPISTVGRNVIVTATRGPRTRDALGLAPSLPIGDPALLLSNYMSRPQKVHRWGVIPHVIDREHPAIDYLKSQSGVYVIDLANPDLLATASQIAACDFIASSSLHGLITADSFGIPNVRLRLGPLVGGDWKFMDYFESVGRIAYVTDGMTDVKTLERSATTSDRDLVEARARDLEAAFTRLHI